MKLKDFLQQFEGLDPETEIYQTHDENDDGEILLNPNCILQNVQVIECPWYKPEINHLLMIPNHAVCNLHSPKKAWVIL